MFLGMKSKPKLYLNINGIRTRNTLEALLLGILIDWKLTFNKHVKSLCKNANRKASALIRLRKDLGVSQKTLLYDILYPQILVTAL